MKQITDYKEISPLVMKYFKRGVITNNFLTSEDYKAEIEEGRLFYESNDSCLCIFVKRDGFYQLYFHALSDNEKLFDGDMKVICDISVYEGSLLTHNGFSQIGKRVRLETSSSLAEVSNAKAKAEDGDKAFELMKASFNKYTGYLPTLTQLRTECEKGLVYKLEKDGKLAGVLRSGKSGRVSQIKHLCVAEEFRGVGIGKALCLEFLKECEKATVWTGQDNLSAIGLYRSVGFELTQTASTIYEKE